MRRLRVFLCHASEDKPAVRDLYARLKEAGFDAWLDEESLIGGQEWEPTIRTTVRESDVVVVCLSNHSINKKGFVQKEIRIALDVADEHPEDVIYIVPVRLMQCSIPSRLGKWHAIDLFSAEGFLRLQRTLTARAVMGNLWTVTEDNSVCESGERKDNTSEAQGEEEFSLPSSLQELRELQNQLQASIHAQESNMLEIGPCGGTTPEDFAFLDELRRHRFAVDKRILEFGRKGNGNENGDIRE